MGARTTIKFGIIISALASQISGCQPLIQEISSATGTIIPSDDNLPDISDAVPIPSPSDTRSGDTGSGDTTADNTGFSQNTTMPTHVAAKVPETTLTAIEPASIAPPPAPTVPKFYPANTMGWQKTELVQVLGNADYIRRDGEGEVHQYKLETCIIDFTLFPKSGHIEIIAWHGRSRIQHQNIDAEACYENLASRKAGK